MKFGSGRKWIGFDSAEIHARTEVVCVEPTVVVSRCEDFVNNGFNSAAQYVDVT